jgi:glucokinase
LKRFYFIFSEIPKQLLYLLKFVIMNLNPKFPLYLPGVKNTKNENVTILGANLREDETVLAYYVSGGQGLEMKMQKKYITKDFSSLNEIVRDFIVGNALSGTERFGISVPGPVINGKSSPARLGWNLDVQDFKTEFGFQEVYMLNDQEAAAYGIGLLEDTELEDIRFGGHLENGNVAIIAPGNGLGEAGYFFDGKYLRPMPSEGGHSEFAPRTDVEFELVKFLQKTYGEIIVWERLVSGPAIYKIYEFLRDVKGYEEQAWLTQKLAEAKDKSAVISETAMSGLCTTCVLAMEMLVDFMARRANNMVLNYKATGGLILAGGIPPRIYNFINKDKIEESFLKCDEMEPLLAGIPIYLNLNSKTALYGAAYYGAFSE